ncbi:hypothetical protein FACS1894176_08860 [Bacteroidia bacterium]|nr:hypothetical protein FACS1894176_08860 [Bacteroidia bacterium]
MKKLVDFLLLNAYSVNSIGLYDGKAGLSLCLFEFAHYLNDEQTEDRALELLQESIALATKSNDISFENGLAGLGFALLYLIENKFIDADFNELFSDQSNKILTEIKSIEDFSEKQLPLVYFIESLNRLQPKFDIGYWRNKILSDVESNLEQQLKNKDTSAFDSYLKAISDCDNYTPSLSVLRAYVDLYQQGKVASSFTTGFYLEKLAVNLQDSDLIKMAQANKNTALQTIYPQTMTLDQQIDLLYMLNHDQEQYAEQITLLEKDLFDTTHPLYEKKIAQRIHVNGLKAGYRYGIARLLLYWIYRDSQRKHQDCTRFQSLFR